MGKYIKRLKHWVHVLENVRKREDADLVFNMGNWCWLPSNSSLAKAIKNDMSCGASACALGWAALDPTFRKQGLTLVDLGYDDIYIWLKNTKKPKWGDTFELSILACTKFFGISHDDARYIVDPAEYTSWFEVPIYKVIRRIKSIIKRYE